MRRVLVGANAPERSFSSHDPASFLLLLCSKNGLVINLSSFSGDFPVPMMAVYSATKAFIDNWTVAMSQECVSPSPFSFARSLANSPSTFLLSRYKADKIVFMSAKPYLTVPFCSILPCVSCATRVMPTLSHTHNTK